MTTYETPPTPPHDTPWPVHTGFDHISKFPRIISLEISKSRDFQWFHLPKSPNHARYAYYRSYCRAPPKVLRLYRFYPTFQIKHGYQIWSLGDQDWTERKSHTNPQPNSMQKSSLSTIPRPPSHTLASEPILRDLVWPPTTSPSPPALRTQTSTHYDAGNAKKSTAPDLFQKCHRVKVAVCIRW